MSSEAGADISPMVIDVRAAPRRVGSVVIADGSVGLTPVVAGAAVELLPVATGDEEVAAVALGAPPFSE
jgi:hypothetical protein